MKKNIEYVHLDSLTASWLIEHLPVGELRQGIEALVNDACSTLMIETDVHRIIDDFTILRYGGLEINTRFRKVQRDGLEISLTPKEYDILLFLVRNKGVVFTKEQIYQAVWDNEYLMDDSNIMAFIRKLRKKIEPHPDSPEYIITIWGIGYKFNDKI